MLEERRLDKKRHDCAGFDCGVAALNEYLRRYASQDRRRHLTSIFVLVEQSRPHVILGYYTLSAAQVDSQQLSAQEQGRLPRYPIPCFRMGRFAVSLDQQGRGLGKTLLGLAVERCLQACESVAAYALLVDAKDASARLFYEHFGFRGFADQPHTLYLALGNIEPQTR